MPNSSGLSLKVLLRSETGSYLALRRSRRWSSQTGRWDLPGGPCDPAEPLTAALGRVAGELGLTAAFERVRGTLETAVVVEAVVTSGVAEPTAVWDRLAWLTPAQLAQTDWVAGLADLVRADGAVECARPAVDRERFQRQVQQYRAARPRYQQLATFLAETLSDGANELGLHVIVQARAKTVASFAEKILRPGKHYPDPLNDLPDLCGCRVICQTLHGVRQVSELIESRFEVSPGESEDKLDILGANEFGYLSTHYVVRLPETASAELLGLKAEVQVRTVLQHGWADVAHELSYKNRFKLPRLWSREFARLAAVLEEGDRAIERIRQGLELYASSYDAYYTPAELDRAIEVAEIVLEEVPREAGVAHELAKMQIARGRWDQAVSVLEPLLEDGGAALWRDYGMSLCKLHRGGDPEAYERGQAALRRAVELAPSDLDAWASLAGTWRALEQQAIAPAERERCRREAQGYYRRAYELDPGDPYPLGNYLEYELADHPELDLVSHFRAPLTTAVERCSRHVEVGVNLPWAWFDLGKFSLLLGDVEAALASYAKGVSCCNVGAPVAAALSSFETLRPARERLAGYDLIVRFLGLAQAFRFGESAALPQPTGPLPTFVPPVLWVSGVARADLVPALRETLLAALAEFRGTIVCGGTLAGVVGFVGELQELFPDTLRTIGYLPQSAVERGLLDGRYQTHRVTPGTTFSSLEPLTAWTELQAAGVPLDQVRMLCVGGGRLSLLECQLAIALGVPVGLLSWTGQETATLLDDPQWAASPVLRELPAEPDAIAAFVRG